MYVAFLKPSLKRSRTRNRVDHTHAQPHTVSKNRNRGRFDRFEMDQTASLQHLVKRRRVDGVATPDPIVVSPFVFVPIIPFHFRFLTQPREVTRDVGAQRWHLVQSEDAEADPDPAQIRAAKTKSPSPTPLSSWQTVLQELHETERVWIDDEICVVLDAAQPLVTGLVRAHQCFATFAKSFNDTHTLPLTLAREMLWTSWCERNRTSDHSTSDTFEKRRFCDLNELELLDYEFVHDEPHTKSFEPP